MDSLKKSLIWFFLILLCGLPISFLAFGSDIQTQQSALYPFQSTVMMQDDFLTGIAVTGQIGALGWQSAGTITYNGGATNRPGIFRFDTGAVLGTLSRINFAGSTSFTASNTHNIIWVARLNTNDANTTIRIGSSGSVAANPPADGIYFEKLDGDTNWFCVTRAGGAQTRTDSTVAVNTNFNNFTYMRESGSVLFLLNGSVVCSHTTNITSALSSAYIFIINSAAAAKSFDVDYFQFRMYGLTR